jgi:hypothetical protein
MTINNTDSGQPEPQPCDGGGSSVEDAVAEAIEIVRQELMKPGFWRVQEFWRVKDLRQRMGLRPVRRKVFMMIHDRLQILQASLPRPATGRGDRGERLDSRILETVKLVDGRIAENAAWDVADSLKELLPEVASAEYVYWALVEEKGHGADRAHNWSKYFPAKELDCFIKRYEKNPKRFDTSKSAQRLVALYRIRDGQGRHDRACEGMRWEYLLWVSGLLALSAGLLVAFWVWASNTPGPSLPYILLGFVSGAMGAVLSGTLRLRDLGRIVELQGAWKTLIPQVVLGATLAMIVILILLAGIVSIGFFDLEAAKPAQWFVVGLLSGFSEPFALGILKRLTALGDEQKTP